MTPEIKPRWKHQDTAIKLANKMSTETEGEYAHNNFAFFMEAGTGKSRTIVEILSERFDFINEVLPTIVFAPIVVCENLRREFLMYSDIDESLIGVYTMNGPKRKNLLYEDINKKKKKILIINYESVTSKDVLHLLHTFRPQVAVCDESHRLKSHNAKRSQAIEKLLRHCKWKFLLTGTPALKNPMDLFMQFKIMDNGETFGENFWAFRGHYFEDKNARWVGKPHYFPDFKLRKEAGAMLEQKLKHKTYSVLRSECLDLPDIVLDPIVVELSREQRRLYEDMKRDLITFVQDKHDKPKAVVATQAMTKLLRLQQIVSGFVTTAEGEIIEVKDNPRMKALEDKLEDLVENEKVIVWACFKHNYTMISKLLDKIGVKYVMCTGDQSQKEKQAAIDAFQTDASVRVMLANQRAGGIGVNLTQASAMIYYSKNFSLEDDVQSEARNHRGGSEIHERILRVDLVAEGTVDDLINQSLKIKKELLFDVLDWSSI